MEKEERTEMLNPFCDEGFKRIFGDKILLMDFLNSFVDAGSPIVDLTYENKEMVSVERSICEDGVISVFFYHDFMIFFLVAGQMRIDMFELCPPSFHHHLLPIYHIHTSWQYNFFSGSCFQIEIFKQLSVDCPDADIHVVF